MLSDEQLAGFARDGYLVVPQAITEELLAQAGATVDRLIRAQPPPAGQAGAHFYWPSAVEAPELVTLARDGGLIELAGELAGPGTVDIAFDQTQVALNIPPNPFDPGGPHLDGYEPGCTEPGSFTLRQRPLTQPSKITVWVSKATESVVFRTQTVILL